LRSGQSLTPFVLEALLGLQETEFARPQGAVARALDFLKRNTNADGALGLADSAGPDYPCYATAVAARMARRTGHDVGPWIAWLRSQQFTEDAGWKRDDAPFGGWGMGSALKLAPPEPGHVDLSMTRHVLEAMAVAGVRGDDPMMERARAFVERCQNPDGGFVFSPVNLETNKAGEEGGRYRSYGSATADGVLALRAAGAPADDSRVTRGVEWLRAHHNQTHVPGFENGPREAWGLGLRFYYAAAIIRAVPGLPVLLLPQKADGSWANPNNLVKEDDPLIATGFAVRVLTGVG
jgi:hypothetical protein